MNPIPITPDTMTDAEVTAANMLNKYGAEEAHSLAIGFAEIMPEGHWRRQRWLDVAADVKRYEAGLQ